LGRRAGNGRTTQKKANVSPEQAAYEAAVSLPETVTVAIAELAGEMQEGMLALVVNAGLKVIDALFEEEATALAGPKGRHDPNRGAVRHGSDDGLVTLGARRFEVRRLRLRSADGSTEVPLATYEWARDTELLERQTMARMLAKLSCRRYGVGLEPMGAAVEEKSRSVSKSAVSRRFVAATESALAELMSVDLSGLDLVAIMIDGTNFGGHLCVVCLGIGIDGTKHPLALVEGDTENATVVKRLLVDLRRRGLDVTKPTLFVIDGSTALPPAIKAVFDHPVIARCEEHKSETYAAIFRRTSLRSWSAGCAVPTAIPTPWWARVT
jgi:putative transposase